MSSHGLSSRVCDGAGERERAVNITHLNFIPLARSLGPDLNVLGFRTPLFMYSIMDLQILWVNADGSQTNFTHSAG